MMTTVKMLILLFILGIGLIVFQFSRQGENTINKPSLFEDKTSSTSLTTPTSPVPELPQKMYPQTERWDRVHMSESDSRRRQDVQDMQFKMVAYKIKYKTYPLNAAEANAAQQTNPLIDPDTKLPYKFVDGTPKIGEMQYKLSTTCDLLNRVFESVDSKNIYAFLVPLSEGSFICKSNIQ